MHPSIAGNPALHTDDTGQDNSRTLGSGLVSRAVIGLLSIFMLCSLLLLIGIDRFVSAQFTELHEQRSELRTEEIRALAMGEQARIGSMAELIGGDANLRHSAHYHLISSGERRPLDEDLVRLGNSFRMDLIGLWTNDGELISANNQELLPIVHGTPVEEGSRMVWARERLWLSADYPFVLEGQVLAWIRVVQRSTLTSALGAGDAFVVSDSARDTPLPANALELPISSSQGDRQIVEVRVSDTVEEALQRAKRIILLGLLAAAGVLAIASTYYLKRLIGSVRALAEAALMLPNRLEAGTLRPVALTGYGEIADLGRAFDSMIQNLVERRDLEARLRDKEKLAAVGCVALRVAHDLNNPLTVIKSIAHLQLSEVEKNTAAAKDLELIVHHSGRCTSIVDNLLRFGKPVKLRQEPLDLREVLRQYTSGISQRRLPCVLEIRAQTGPLEVLGDSHQLEQMLDNLLDNAFEANGGNAVTVSLGRTRERKACISIRDNGGGFSPDVLERVFELFYTTKETGTGLGLPNARAIALAHKGDIQVTDTESGEVTVTLPLIC